jgi:hypothetical protein
MPGMKITLDAAMRARDVSRPRADDERPVPARETDAATEQPRAAPAAGSITGADQDRDGSFPAAADIADAAGADGTDTGPKAEPGRRRRRRR